MISRRAFFVASALAAIDTATSSRLLLAASRRRFGSLPGSLAQLEKDSNGRLGVAVLDTGSGESSGHRADERFAMCSTFKMLLAAVVLERVDSGKERKARRFKAVLPPFAKNAKDGAPGDWLLGHARSMLV
jgi:beta-lactamase class A